MSQQRRPTVIWVVGDNTNVGKTTVSASLIRVLNTSGKSAVGFKPYAGARLIDVVDFLADVAAVDGLWVGKDARMLAQASPLTANDLLEVINPSWRISHPGRDVSVFIRKGSEKIRRRSFFHTQNAVPFLERKDTLHLNRYTQLPFAQTRPIHVASRTIIRTFTKEMWMGSVPIFHGLHRRLAFQC
jgi:predicted P-loop ATPase/GTPase